MRIIYDQFLGDFSLGLEAENGNGRIISSGKYIGRDANTSKNS